MTVVADAIGLEHRPDEQISKLNGPSKRMRRTQEFAALDLELGEYVDLLSTIVFSIVYAWMTMATFPDIPFSSFVVWFPIMFGIALFASQMIITMTSLGCCTWYGAFACAIHSCSGRMLLAWPWRSFTQCDILRARRKNRYGVPGRVSWSKVQAAKKVRPCVVAEAFWRKL
jgi:hypothetical protein